MTNAQAKREADWADGLHLELRYSGPPMDLYAVARHQKVKRLKLRPMIQRGALLPASGGYEVIIRSLETKDLNLESPEPVKELTAKQRFTLAHEVAHTRFYKDSKGKPVPTSEAKEYAYAGDIELEEICDRAAKRLLVPTDMLKKEIRGKLNGDTQRIDAGFVRLMVARFRTSYEVMIERLRAADLENVFTRCILLVRQRNDEATISTWYMGVSLLGSFPALEQYKPLGNWFPGFSESVAECERNAVGRVDRHGRKFSIQKFPLGKRGDFLLQIDDSADRAPNSNLSW